MYGLYQFCLLCVAAGTHNNRSKNFESIEIYSSSDNEAESNCNAGHGYAIDNPTQPSSFHYNKDPNHVSNILYSDCPGCHKGMNHVRHARTLDNERDLYISNNYYTQNFRSNHQIDDQLNNDVHPIYNQPNTRLFSYELTSFFKTNNDLLDTFDPLGASITEDAADVIYDIFHGSPIPSQQDETLNLVYSSANQHGSRFFYSPEYLYSSSANVQANSSPEILTASVRDQNGSSQLISHEQPNGLDNSSNDMKKLDPPDIHHDVIGKALRHVNFDPLKGFGFGEGFMGGSGVFCSITNSELWGKGENILARIEASKATLIDIRKLDCFVNIQPIQNGGNISLKINFSKNFSEDYTLVIFRKNTLFSSITLNRGNLEYNVNVSLGDTFIIANYTIAASIASIQSFKDMEYLATMLSSFTDCSKDIILGLKLH